MARINLYEEELTSEVVITNTLAKGHDIPFYGVRTFLKSPDDLHSSEDDDDRSAVTFWFSNLENAVILRDAIKRSMEMYLDHKKED